MAFDASNLTQHPLSAAYPAMEKADFDGLCADIRKVGLREPITLFEGQILDGWHRYNACMCEGKNAAYVEFDDGDPREFVISKNGHRRHLTASQRAAAIVKAMDWRPRGGDGSNQHESKSVPGTDPSSSSEMAKAAHVSVTMIEKAKTAERGGLGDAVRDGKVSAKDAAAIAKAPTKVQVAAKAAIEKGEKPVLPAPAKISEAEKLQIELDEVRELNADMARDLEVYLKVAEAGGDTDNEIARLMTQLRAVESQRDSVLRENAQLKREIKSLRRKLGMPA